MKPATIFRSSIILVAFSALVGITVLPFIGTAANTVPAYAGRFVKTPDGQVWFVDGEQLARYSLNTPAESKETIRVRALGISSASLNKIRLSSTGTLANSRDTDGDGLADAVEVAVGTDPITRDTDSDGYSDYTELINGYSPLLGNRATLPINQRFANSLKGTILLQADAHGELWYVSPTNGLRYYLGTPDTTLKRNAATIALSVSAQTLNKIPVAKIIAAPVVVPPPTPQVISQTPDTTLQPQPLPANIHLLFTMSDLATLADMRMRAYAIKQNIDTDSAASVRAELALIIPDRLYQFSNLPIDKAGELLDHMLDEIWFGRYATGPYIRTNDITSIADVQIRKFASAQTMVYGDQLKLRESFAPYITQRWYKFSGLNADGVRAQIDVMISQVWQRLGH